MSNIESDRPGMPLIAGMIRALAGVLRPAGAQRRGGVQDGLVGLSARDLADIGQGPRGAIHPLRPVDEIR